MKKIGIVLVMITACIWADTCNENVFLNALHTYTWANYETFCGRNTHADCWYKTFFSLTDDHHGYKGYVYFLHQKNDFAKIVELRDTISTHFAHDHQLQKLLAFALKSSGDATASDHYFIELARTFPENQEIVFHAINANIRQQQYADALAMIEHILTHSDAQIQVALFHFLKAQIYLALDKKNEAKHALKECLTANKHFEKGWLLLGLLAEQEGNIAEALQHFLTYLKNTKDAEPHIKKHIQQLLQKQKGLLQRYSWLLLGYHSIDTSELYVQALLEYDLPSIHTSRINRA